MISLENVSKTYAGRNFEVHALTDLTLQIPTGEYVSIVGKSGSGKSTLLKILGLLDFDHQGTYLFGGVDYQRSSDSAVGRARRRIGYIFQDFQLVERFTVRRNLEVASVVKSGAVQPEQIDRALAVVGLTDKALSYPDELSGGQKQRVAIARATLGNPEMLIADEPTGALDSATGDQVLAMLREIHRTRGCTLVVVTHDHDVASTADRLVELVGGTVSRDVLR